jgi:hypothetical protein
VDPANPGDLSQRNEFIYLLLREQEVSAVEDLPLQEVALGGPDSAQRSRLIQRIVRLAVDGTNCATALEEAKRIWIAQGVIFQPQTMELKSSAKLQVQFVEHPPPESECDPTVPGGYLGADNQLIRVQITGFDAATNTGRFVWGYNNASFLYRVKTVDAQTLELQSSPVDSYHAPRMNRAVELLRVAESLDHDNYIAEHAGVVITPTQAYVPETRHLQLPAPLPAGYVDLDHVTPRFLRLWEQELTFTPGTAKELEGTGIQVIINYDGAVEPFTIGQFWTFAVRPSTPVQLYPRRYLDAPQPPEGPRLWACPLAVLSWPSPQPQPVRVQDCRRLFCPLVPHALHVTNTNWDNDSIFTLERLREEGLLVTLDAAPEPLCVNTATIIVEVETSFGNQSAAWSAFHFRFIPTGDLTISGNSIKWTPTRDVIPTRDVTTQLGQLLETQPSVRVRVTLKGHTIWSGEGEPRLYLDGQAFGQPYPRPDSARSRIALRFPSGDGECASDFESWFYIGRVLQVRTVRFLDVQQVVSHVVDYPPGPSTGVRLRNDQAINTIEISFSRAVRTEGFGAPGPQSVRVEILPSMGMVEGEITTVSDTVVRFITRTPEAFSAGQYRLVVLGTDAGAPAVRASDNGAELDGNFDNWPGGDFVLPFEVPSPVG